jgi:hypothetical protein
MAENLSRELEEVTDDLEGNWNIVVVAITLDTGGEAPKAHKMARRKRPCLVAPDCYGHHVYQVKLCDVRSSFFSPCRTTLLHSRRFFQERCRVPAIHRQATELIGWLRGKTYVLVLLRDVQETNSLHILAVIRAALTR